MSWLVPSLPSIPGWSRATPASSSSSLTVKSNASISGEEEDDLDVPPPFPLLDSHQRSSAPPPTPVAETSRTPTPSFSVAPPSPPRIEQNDDDPPSDLNIGIIPDNIPLGNMAPPPSTTSKPAFGIQKGGEDRGSLAAGSAAKTNGAPASKAKKRAKVALTPGHSALDWARLTSSGQDLRGVAGFQRVTMAELKEHNTPDDAWSAFNGMVYNITAYLPFHPGGEEELMRVAGRDGTKLFMLTHSWVNLDYMLKECMVGVLVRG